MWPPPHREASHAWRKSRVAGEVGMSTFGTGEIVIVTVIGKDVVFAGDSGHEVVLRIHAVRRGCNRRRGSDFWAS